MNGLAENLGTVRQRVQVLARNHKVAEKVDVFIKWDAWAKLEPKGTTFPIIRRLRPFRDRDSEMSFETVRAGMPVLRASGLNTSKDRAISTEMAKDFGRIVVVPESDVGTKCRYLASPPPRIA